MNRVLKPGSLFRFASDIEGYVNWTLQHVEAAGGFEFVAKTADDWRIRMKPGPAPVMKPRPSGRAARQPI